MLEYNKLYQSLKKISADWHAGHIQWQYYWNYFMFFSDGTLIEATIASEDFKKIKLNFSKKNDALNHFQYTWNEKEFDIHLDGAILHGGLTSENKLILQSDKTLVWDIYSPID